MITPTASSLKWFVRFLYTQNPFYLVGTFLILFGLQQSLGKAPQLASSGMLAALLAGYTVLLAFVAVVIVRWGNLWDDVRTILLIVVLLFYMLSTSLDVLVLEQPESGSWLLALGLLFCLAVSEFLLRQLRLQLPTEYRAALYGSLAALFLYPIALAWISFFRWYELRIWAIGGFSLIAALPLLAMIPAARSGTGTPLPCRATWRTPWYPWSVFVFLTIGMGLRAWWLTISFDPTKGDGSCFEPYFLIPLAPVWAAVFTEAGIVHRSRWAMAIGLLLPWVAVLLGYLGAGTSRADLAFLSKLTSTIGTPPQVAIWCALAFQGYAFVRTLNLRKNALVEICFTATALLACVTGRETLDATMLVAPNAAGLALVGAAWMANAWRLGSSYRALIAAAVSGCFVANWDLALPLSNALAFWRLHALPLILLCLVVLFHDALAQRLRAQAMGLVPGMALAAAAIYPGWFRDVPLLHLAGYVGLLTLLAVRLWQLERAVPQLTAAGITALSNLLLLVWPAGDWLRTSWLAAGLPYLSAGVAVVVAGIGVSLLKMGAIRQARHWLHLLNSRLLLAPDESG